MFVVVLFRYLWLAIGDYFFEDVLVVIVSSLDENFLFI